MFPGQTELKVNGDTTEKIKILHYCDIFALTLHFLVSVSRVVPLSNKESPLVYVY